MPSVGSDAAPPELLSAADKAGRGGEAEGKGQWKGMQGEASKEGQEGIDELKVGELEGASFRVEPLRRTGEDAATMRARLLCELLV